MLRKTIAVGPLEPVASCVTGGTGVAKERVCGSTSRDAELAPRALGSFPREFLSAMIIVMAQEDCVRRENGKSEGCVKVEMSLAFSMLGLKHTRSRSP
jgi:hypothetical protein